MNPKQVIRKVNAIDNEWNYCIRNSMKENVWFLVIIESSFTNSDYTTDQCNKFYLDIIQIGG